MRCSLKRLIQSLTLALLIGGFFSSLGLGTTFYVAKSGNDSNSGTQADPFLTINRALSAVGFGTGAGAGITIEVAGGVYNERLGPAWPNGTSFLVPFTLRAKSGDIVVIIPTSTPLNVPVLYFSNANNQYIILQDLVIDGSNTNRQSTVFTSGARHIKLINLDIRNTRWDNGILISTGDTDIQVIGGKIHDGMMTSTNDPTRFGYGIYCTGNFNIFDGIEIYNVPRWGVHIYDSFATPHDNIIRNCNVHNHTQSPAFTAEGGILLARGSNNQAYNNIVRDGGGHGISVGYSATNSKIWNNTIYRNAQTAVQLLNCVGVEIRNSIFFSNGADAIIQAGGGTSCTGVIQSNNLSIDPKFISSSDLHLRPDSSAIGAGVNLSSSFRDDKDGKLRPLAGPWTIGAYEFGGTALPPSPPIVVTPTIVQTTSFPAQTQTQPPVIPTMNQPPIMDQTPSTYVTTTPPVTTSPPVAPPISDSSFGLVLVAGAVIAFLALRD